MNRCGGSREAHHIGARGIQLAGVVDPDELDEAGVVDEPDELPESDELDELLESDELEELDELLDEPVLVLELEPRLSVL